jgi:hypothetical protein
MVPKIADSNPAEAVGFFGRKYPQHAFLGRGSRLSHVADLRHVKNTHAIYVEVGIAGKIGGPFLA